MLVIQNINTFYGDRHVLRDVSFEVKAGKVVMLLGRNGMGKTTTMRSIIGFNPPKSGSIIFNGKNIAGMSPEKIARTGIGLVPQGRMIFTSLSVEENLKIAARNANLKNSWTLEKIYGKFPRLKKMANYKSNLLNGGEQQMLAIARALMINPELILLDEPSEGLAPTMIEEIWKIIRKLKEHKYSILLAEQNISQALDIADYTYIMSKGTIVHESIPEDLRKNETIMNKYLGVE